MNVLECLKALKKNLKPNTWCQRVSAMDKNGCGVDACSPRAVKRCLVGHLYNVTDMGQDPVFNKVYDALSKHCVNPLNYNDAPKRTFTDIKNLVNKAIKEKTKMTETLNTTITLNVAGEKFQRKVRRVRTLEDGTQVGWVSFEGKDTKVRKKGKKKTWELL
jgi:hypothetical protein